MKKYLFIVLLVGVCFGQSLNPCEDKRFLKISEKTLDVMTEREYQYFLKKEQECQEYNKDNNSQKPISTDVKTHDYTNFLISLGCKYDNNVLKYYNKNLKKWVVVEDQISFLNTLGYREGSSINRVEGELYLFKNGKWVGQGNANNQTLSGTNANSYSLNSSSSGSSIHIFASYDLSGVYKIDDEDENDVSDDVSIGMDLMLFGNNEASFGIGGEYQAERKLVDNDIGKFYFIPAYCVFRMKSQQANIIGKVGLSYHFADEDFTGESLSNYLRASFKEDLYLAAGINISLTKALGIQFLWSRNKAEIIYDELDTSLDVQFDKISVGFSLNADN